MNKKAQLAFKILNMSVWRLIFLTIMFFAIYQFAESKLQQTVDVDDLRANILENRIFYSGAVTVVDSEIGRVHPDVIDFRKFTTPDSLENEFDYNNSRVAVMLELRNLETDEINATYLNKVWYERWEPLTSFKDYKKNIRWRYVLIDYGSRIEPGLVRLDMVTSNE